jgi:hypothetical protein
LLAVLGDQSCESVEFALPKTATLMQSNRLQPELARILISFNMHVARLGAIR